MALDWSTLIGSVSGGVLGFVGSILSDVVGVFKARAQHKMDMERMEFQSKLDVQKADLLLRQTTEEQAGNNFGKAIDAQTQLVGHSPWVKDVLALFRPGLTALMLLFSGSLALWKGGDALDFCCTTFVSLSATALGYWFGVRTSEKVQIRIATRKT